MGDRLKTAASLIVQLVDDFTGRLITDGSVRLSIAGQKPPIRKSDGYYIFLNRLDGEEVTVRAEGGIYEPESVIAATGRDADGVMHTVRIRMTPGRAYPVPPDATRIEGTAEPGCAVRIICRESANNMKLLYDYELSGENGDTISIFHNAGEDIVGRLLYIDNDKNTEFLQITERGGDAEDVGVYRLNKPLSRAYKKIGTTIYPVFSAAAGADGRFYIPIAGLREKENVFLCMAIGKRTFETEIILKTGATHRLDLTGGNGEMR